MSESEYALETLANSTDAATQRETRVVNTILMDSRKYRLWESRHADMLLPVAENANKKPQIMALRNADVKLIHRRALFTYLQTHSVFGEERRSLFRDRHPTIDFEYAVLAEHEQYMLAVSSGISSLHLMDIMNDNKSKKLFTQYENLYANYFELHCYINGVGSGDCIELGQFAIIDVKTQLTRLRRRIETAAPDAASGNFDRQEALARSGRYPILNYMLA